MLSVFWLKALIMIAKMQLSRGGGEAWNGLFEGVFLKPRGAQES